MRVTVKCDGSRVTAGARETFNLIKYRTGLVLNEVANTCTDKAVEYLEESYVRPDWTQTGNLARAIFNSFGRFSRDTWSSGVADIRILGAQAPYWDEIEGGTDKYVGDIHRGYFIDEAGRHFSPKVDMYRKHKWVETGAGYDMEVKRPITAHNYFKKTSVYAEIRFVNRMVQSINGVFLQ